MAIAMSTEAATGAEADGNGPMTGVMRTALGRCGTFDRSSSVQSEWTSSWVRGQFRGPRTDRALRNWHCHLAVN